MYYQQPYHYNPWQGLSHYPYANEFTEQNLRGNIRTASQSYVQQILSEWTGKPLEGAHSMIKKYGLPIEATPSMLIWYNNGPWKQTVVYRETIPHNFPKPHKDFLAQTINYQIPIGLFDEIAKFDGSVIVDRTKGTVTARCHKEPMNFLSLNLVHDIVTKKRTVQEARLYYGEIVRKFEKGIKTPYTEGFIFQVPKYNTNDPGITIL